LRALSWGRSRREVEDNGAGEVVIDVLLGEEFVEVGSEFEALESGGDEVKGLGSLAGSLACACWVEVREIETSDNCPES
jgi:hypothetical protein